jgi:hypothetical protein
MGWNKILNSRRATLGEEEGDADWRGCGGCSRIVVIDNFSFIKKTSVDY